MVNLVFVKFKHSEKQYLYRIPNCVEVEKDDELLVPGNNDTKLSAITSSANFKVDPSVVLALMEELDIGHIKNAYGIKFYYESGED